MRANRAVVLAGENEDFLRAAEGAGEGPVGEFARQVRESAVVVWQLARDQRPQAEEMRQVLVKLSGRQMKRGKAVRGFTEPALLAGMGVLVPMLELMDHYDLATLRSMAKTFLPRLRRDGG